MEELLTAETKNFQSIMSESKKIKVPTYQRAYSWGEAQWSELIEDILNSKKNKTKHYLGSIVFINRANGEMEIVDGQQRLTTISIIIHAAIKLLDELIKLDVDVDKNIQRKDLLKGFVGKKSSVDLTWASKLVLNEENERFYSMYIMNTEQVGTVPHKKSESNKLLVNCQTYFHSQLLKYVGVEKIEKINDNKTKKILELIEYIVENLVFVKIVAINELSAYTIFETLNDRGIDLSISDLLKNYILSLFKRKQDAKIALDLWNEIIDKVELKNFPVFLRYYWIIYNKNIKKEDLFKEIKTKVVSRKEALELLKELNEYAEIFSALEDENSDYWVNKDLKIIIRNLHILRVKQCYPMLMVTLKNVESRYHIPFFHACEVISFRYLTISEKNPNVLEGVYNQICNKIIKGEIKNSKQLTEELKERIYIKDSDFVNAFSTKIISNKSHQKIARYILCMINKKISLDGELNDNELTLEHILPQNPEQSWLTIFDEKTAKEYCCRLGNMTLLSKTRNKNGNNSSFEEKKEIYNNSTIEITKNISTLYTEWNVESIEKRQKFMANLAKDIWKI